MTIKTTICDCCKAPEAFEVTYFTERKTDAARSMENEYEHVDLCARHLAEVLNKLMEYRGDSVARVPLLRSYKKNG